MKIIPLQTTELKTIISSGKNYKNLYITFEEAFYEELAPHEWYSHFISERL